MRRFQRLPAFRQPLLARFLGLCLAHHTPPCRQFALLRPQAVLPVVVLQNGELSCGLSKGLLNSIQTPLLNKQLPEGYQPLRQPPRQQSASCPPST